mgnify:CR=1 FL=1
MECGSPSTDPMKHDFFSVMGETQVGGPFFKDDFLVLTLEKGTMVG